MLPPLNVGPSEFARGGDSARLRAVIPRAGPNPSQSQILQSTRFMSGQAGIGAQGRSPRSQPFAPPSRSTERCPAPSTRRDGEQVPTAAATHRDS
ncbi:uncharacterized protein B0H18DRAFT_967036 [Fomitopsis serialis]|uniref:uncharacterized protein n=1 Tax=Fomitopsis serialis TaxID=139415 RepID=UPI002007DD6B|nr:uncharacterized protein B0H18DRAFT_967036 [Neoantrodia serialis]KAH9938412.1 hypothetical protein B0H18DRAFT_967036 [Neoantrodia serialis]